MQKEEKKGPSAFRVAFCIYAGLLALILLAALADDQALVAVCPWAVAAFLHGLIYTLTTKRKPMH